MKVTKEDVEKIISANKTVVNLGTKEDFPGEEWILKAEEVLGFSLTESYKWFLRSYRSGEIGGEEVYSIYGRPFESISGGDIVVQHWVDMKYTKNFNNKHLVVQRSDIDGDFYFDYNEYSNGECPIYSHQAACKYAQNFYEFIYFRLSQYLGMKIVRAWR